MIGACKVSGHREKARAEALRCDTCVDAVERSDAKPEGCIQCGRLISYYSHSPGYCTECAHDPCWRSIDE
jgi:hypothetical protein